MTSNNLLFRSSTFCSGFLLGVLEGLANTFGTHRNIVFPLTERQLPLKIQTSVACYDVKPPA